MGEWKFNQQLSLGDITNMLFFQNKNIFKTTASARPPSFSAQPHESHPQGADSQSKKASADRDLHSSVVLSARHNWHSSSGTDAGRCCKPRYRFRENRHILPRLLIRKHEIVQ